MKTAIKTPDWSVIAAPGAELGQIQRDELLKMLSLVKHIESLAMRSVATLVHHVGGPEAMNETEGEVRDAAWDGRNAHQNAKELRKRIERMLSGLE